MSNRLGLTKTKIINNNKKKHCFQSKPFKASPNIKLNIWLVGAGRLSVYWPIDVQLVVFFCSSVSMELLTPMGSPGVSTGCNSRVLIFASSRSFY